MTWEVANLNDLRRPLFKQEVISKLHTYLHNRCVGVF